MMIDDIRPHFGRKVQRTTDEDIVTVGERLIIRLKRAFDDLDVVAYAAESACQISRGQGSGVVDIGHDDPLEQPVQKVQRFAVLIGEDADDQGLVTLGVVGASRGRERLSAVGIMRAVEDHRGVLAQLFKACGMVGVLQSVADILNRDLLAVLLLQYLDDRQRTAQVVDLVRS